MPFAMHSVVLVRRWSEHTETWDDVIETGVGHGPTIKVKRFFDLGSDSYMQFEATLPSRSW